MNAQTDSMKQVRRLFFLACLLISLSQCSIAANTEVHCYEKIPFEYINGKIFIRSEINGVEGRFLLDTGAPTMITQGLYNRIQAQDLNKKVVQDVNKTLSDSILFVKLNKLTLGEVSFSDIEAGVLSENQIMQCLNVDGIIGSDVFQNAIVRISLNEHNITLANDFKSIKIKGKYRTLMNVAEDGKPYFPVRFKGDKKLGAEFLFDTGSDELISLSDYYFETLKNTQLITKRDSAQGRSSFGIFGDVNEAKRSRYAIKEFSVNGSSLKGVVASSGKFPLVGCKLVEYGDVTVDYQNKSFSFEPYEENILVNDSAFPISISYFDDAVRVGAVWEKVDADIHVGDKVLRIDERNVEHASLCELINERPFQGKTQAKIVYVDKSGAEKELLVSKM